MLSNIAIPREYGIFRSAVLRGDIPVNKEVSEQMNIIDSMIENPAFYYDDEAIDGFINFCENELTLTNGEDLNLLPSFKLWAEDLLAWFYYEDESFYNEQTHSFEKRKVLRRLRNKQYLIVGRGAAKTMYGACLHAYFLTMGTETISQFAVANTMRQGELTLDPIRTSIVRSKGPYFKMLTKGNKLSTDQINKQKLASTKKGIQNFLTNSLLEVRPMKIDKLQGFRPKISTVDEWLSCDIREDPIDAIVQGATKNKNWIIVAISSEGTIRNGIGDTIKMELQSILRGDYFDPHTSIWYYKLDDIREVGIPELWLKANPNLGITVSFEDYEKEVRKSEAQPSVRSDMLAKRFGIPVEGYTYFFRYEETELHQKQNFDGMECSLGADLSQGDDFCAFTFLFILGYETIGIKTKCFVSENKVRKLPLATQELYRRFEAEGSLTILPGGILNIMTVYDHLDQYISEHGYIVNSFGYDPYNATEFVARYKQENGPFGVEKVIQGAKTESVPLGELKTLAEARHIVFDQELFKFSMGNAVAIEDNNGNYKLSKRRSREKIDAVAAMLDAWVAYKRYQEA